MKNKKYINLRFTFLLTLGLVIFSGCEREFSDDVEFAEFPPNGNVFIDAFSAGLNYFPFVDAGADPEAFSVETDEVFAGDAAMRFDVPSFGTGFVGATFNTTAKRDLSGFDALTFYAKASQSADINEIGFGIDGSTGNKYRVATQNLQVSTRWQKYIIPIPDATPLTNEVGLFWLAEGAENADDEGGYVLFFDEIQFEKLGTIAQPSPAIFSGEDITQQTFTGSTVMVTGLTQTFNLSSGENVTVLAAPSYFNFESSNTDVAIVNELGEVSVIGEGTTEITALLGGVLAEGSLTIDASGGLQSAPTPTRPQVDVKSIFSNAYVNETEINIAPGFGGSTTEASISSANGDDVIIYANNNFTGIIYGNTVDATELNFMHVDIYVQDPGVEVGIQIRDFGANQVVNTDETNGNPIEDDKDKRFTATGLIPGQWVSFEIPLDGDIATQKNNLGSIILTGGPNFILDNIYFYRE
ncbi:hypothetical protein MTsPCn9_30530 [Croceitalea sp. MTPC9]|uniref:glycosyl hydrolase family 16 n=1 Tax=unclassified Croceitalea TaxID=2632280 RepID=UPI002B3F6BD4|nr:hypothetical protein MTsPCn6_21120 [Croceitalea sp. MTPC6]GMN18113.1 hypothetical protein MTsPCn9_30530 [Croceitalea sp. MTPC9]